ncbi:hypothetical protein GCM10011387_19510 [Pedobacter quisquiliarum]|uniref:Uncharacterized protein n=1 Tax=Pedobacter quisquiliarum TaxID=1834438 RepID=A0A916UB23_9SPHI|nr:hypothetical protein GCM10011387_19510 [Pedobacter quisquiliarum]
MFVVHFVGFPQSPEVDVVCTGKPLESLVDKHIMNQKIGDAIERDAYADVKHKPEALNEVTYAKEKHGYTRKHHEEVVVFLKEMWCFIVVIFMQIPE